ncbi:MAG: AMP-binding protein, partial [Phormidesmis sp.]
MDKTLPAVETKPLNRSNSSYIGSDALVFSDPEGLRSASLHHLVEKQAHKTPSAIAIIHEGKGLSYQALNESANRLAHYLVAQGAKAERLVGISLVRSPEMIV